MVTTRPHFGAIILPVDSARLQQEAPLKPVVTTGGLTTRFDVTQHMTAEVYARNARINHDDPTAVVKQGHEGRAYAFLGPDGPAVMEALRDNQALADMKARVEEARTAASQQAERIMAQIRTLQERLNAIHQEADRVTAQYDALAADVVQQYVDTHAGSVQEVSYEAIAPHQVGRTLSGQVQDGFRRLLALLGRDGDSNPPH